MSDTETRPTPEELADDCTVIASNLRREGSFFATCRAERLELIAQMLRNGAVFVHPDDVPVLRKYPAVELGQASIEHPAHDRGWNACRAHIFGDADE